MIELTILGKPTPKQSARFYGKQVGSKIMIKSYQKKGLVDTGKDIENQVKAQLPKDFVMYDCPLLMEMLFVFPPLASFSKAKIKMIEEGEIVYKDTKPDLHDNLAKLCADSIEGIVYVNDSRICEVKSKKIYGMIPRIELRITPLK